MKNEVSEKQISFLWNGYLPLNVKLIGFLQVYIGYW